MKIEVIVAIISSFVALVSAAIAFQSESHIAQLKHDLEASHEQKMVQLSAELKNQHERELTILRTKLEQQHERQTPYLLEQMRLYLEAVEITAEIAFPMKDSDMESLKTRFWQLYWGPLAVVEDQAVINAMVKFGGSLNSTPGGGESLKQQAITLAHACRDSLQKYWIIDLGEFDEQAKPDL